ncbi:MarR family transcriptional regulator [Microbispora sp. RL4-1S]|uniref:MarR family transcriptional regulator n=1 Tax=Microbispora oryzae TaxID=2806554 RepID=A0A941AIG5_9ACTN|nr:MarR family transcriptional regulator [Microbispora oryzae]MBP2703123.1 MarR family transcriptional regulator [Microbispora oryzae]
MAAPTIDALLTDLAEGGATGALRVGKEGTLFLDRGRVSYAECAVTPGVEDLLAASGRIAAGGIRGARQTAGPGGGGDLLVRRGVLSRGELQFCVLGATLDAAFFLLRPSSARPRFKDGEAHWLGSHWFFTVSGLFRECARRRARLERAWPSPALDALPVVPVRRPPGARVVLTSLQWELLVAADAQATPADLARRLGRPMYGVLLAVRELAAAGLLASPDEPADGESPDPPAGSAAPATPAGASGASGASETVALARRTPGATKAQRDRAGQANQADRPAGSTRQGAGPGALPSVTGDASDVELLIRLRDALEALR